MASASLELSESNGKILNHPRKSQTIKRADFIAAFLKEYATNLNLLGKNKSVKNYPTNTKVQAHLNYRMINPIKLIRICNFGSYK